MSRELTAVELLKEVQGIKAKLRLSAEEWKTLEHGETIGNAAWDFVFDSWDAEDFNETGGNIVEVYYRGDSHLNASDKDLIVVTNDGDYYERGMQFMVYGPDFGLAAKNRSKKDALVRGAMK